MNSINQVKIQTDDYGFSRVELNHVRLDGVQSVAYRREQTGRPIVTIELIAELYQTDPDDELREARRNAAARAEVEKLRREVAGLRDELAAEQTREAQTTPLYGGFNPGADGWHMRLWEGMRADYRAANPDSSPSGLARYKDAVAEWDRAEDMATTAAEDEAPYAARAAVMGVMAGVGAEEAGPTPGVIPVRLADDVRGPSDLAGWVALSDDLSHISALLDGGAADDEEDAAEPQPTPARVSFYTECYPDDAAVTVSGPSLATFAGDVARASDLTWAGAISQMLSRILPAFDGRAADEEE